ncbi:hypothetical protein VTO73DRAFT_6598 [Trametes versicolor]
MCCCCLISSCMYHQGARFAGGARWRRWGCRLDRRCACVRWIGRLSRVWGYRVCGAYMSERSCQAVTRANRNCEDNTMRKT